MARIARTHRELHAAGAHDDYPRKNCRFCREAQAAPAEGVASLAGLPSPNVTTRLKQRAAVERGELVFVPQHNVYILPEEVPRDQ